MKHIIILVIALLFFNVETAMAYHDKAWNKAQKNNRAVNASGCTRATASTTIEYNNVRALIHTGGDMWWDLIGQPRYEIPKGSGKTALFAGAIWMGGTDVNNQLRMAAIRFRSGGVDYWTGPLIISGMDRATVTPDVCTEYDRHFVIERAEVSEFRTYINAVLEGNTELLQSDFSDYQIPEIILNWPANGHQAQGYDHYLAPYFDNDANGYYNPETGGDYPFFDLDGKEDCGTSRELRLPRLYGDQTMWWVYNDKGNVHGETQGEAIGMEIRAQYFAFATADELNNMTFGNYALINRSTYTLYNTYFGVWTDADLGYPYDDYVGCDVTRGLGYLYNGNDVDGTGNNNEYGENPPAIGVDFFEGPYMDPLVNSLGDTVDRPSPYILDANGKPTSVIDPNMPRDTAMQDNAIDYGIYNGGINGLNFGDGIGGNERWGMRRFLYFTNGTSNNGDPEFARQYYNYLRGYWKDNRSLVFGGTGYSPSGGTRANFMFPGETDPENWGTLGVDPAYATPGGWTEENESNNADDRRFVQSAGPFTLLPGAVNDITVGMVWARATGGGAFESVLKVQEADDKAQKLFDNCFVVIDGPDAPELTIIELDKELLFQISNIKGQSNNYKNNPEDYAAEDPFIVCPADNDSCDTKFVFEGYQVFQVKDASVTTADLDNPEFSRLVYQCDVRNDVTDIINYITDPVTGKLQPKLMVTGNNEGIQHTFRLTEDMFAVADRALVNHKEYHYIAVAYAYNQYKLYDPDDGTSLDGQKTPYLRGRKSAKGSIKVTSATPHINKIQDGGIIINSNYGDGVPVTMLEGMGCANNYLNLQQETIDKIMSGEPWRTNVRKYVANEAPVSIKVVDPLNVKNEDFILRFDSVEYTDDSRIRATGYINDATWYIYPKSEDGLTIDTTLLIMPDPVNNSTLAIEYDTVLTLPMTYGIPNVVLSYGSVTSVNGDTLYLTDAKYGSIQIYTPNTIQSEKSIKIENEQVISELGLSFFINQTGVPGPDPLGNPNVNNGFIASSLEYADPTKFWLTAVPDEEGETVYNWIRSGVVDDDLWGSNFVTSGQPEKTLDPDNKWVNMAGGLFSSYRLVSYDDILGTNLKQYQVGFKDLFKKKQGEDFNKNKRTSSIDFVITRDTNLWTRCPVVEMCELDTSAVTEDGVVQSISFKESGPSEGKAPKFTLRKAPSVYRNGKPMPLAKVDSFWVYDQYFVADSGMGWFPGYAIDVETGERLNVFFGEDSRWGAYNGRDMLWNPHEKEATDLYFATGGVSGDLVFGGKHNIYVCGHSYADTINKGWTKDNISVGYDYGQRTFAYLKRGSDRALSSNQRKKSIRTVFNNVIYAARPMLNRQFADYDKENDPYGFIQSDVTIKIRMANPYRGGGSYNKSTFLLPDSLAKNNNAPMFEFSTKGMGATYNNQDVAESALDIINIVPNPYYAFNAYEKKQTQKLAKFTNLPEECTITIYNIGGQQVRKFKKSSPLTYLDWDLKNEYGIEIASGVYIIHIDVPGVGEKVLKWFGALRPIDLNNI